MRAAMQRLQRQAARPSALVGYDEARQAGRDLAGRHRSATLLVLEQTIRDPWATWRRRGEAPAADRRPVQGKKAGVRLYTSGEGRRRMASYAGIPPPFDPGPRGFLG